jgi:hypothetical protein
MSWIEIKARDGSLCSRWLGLMPREDVHPQFLLQSRSRQL